MSNNNANDINNTVSAVPAPTSARAELPTVDHARQLGLTMGLEEARLVLACLSCFIARGHSKTRDKVSQMVAGLVACCHVEGVRDDELVPAALPHLPRSGWPAGATALRRIGIDHRTLESYWARARTRATDASLPLTWVLEFVPAPLWEAVLTLIKWGPAEAGMRLEDAVIELAQQPVAIATRRRPAGATLSAGTINTRITGLHQLFDVLIGLQARARTARKHRLPLELLDPWTWKPERPNTELCGAKWARVDTTGPSFEQARLLLRDVHAEVERAPRQSRYFRRRRRLLAGLELAHGQRVEALRMLDVADYLPKHNFGDGTVGPALVYRPGKTRADDEQHVLALPRELADWLEDWITSTGREIGQGGSPLWPNRKPKPGKPICRINASAFARSISGHAAKDGTGVVPLLQRGEERFHGYNPHGYRHTCYQAARQAGALAKLERPHEFAHVTPDDFARAVVGHDLIRGVGDFYRDLDQQHLARVAIEYLWPQLREQPVQLGLDPDAINDACSRVETLISARNELESELRALDDEQSSLSKQRKALSGDELNAATLRSNSIVFKLAGLQRDIAATQSRLEQAQRDLEEAMTQEVAIDHESDAYGERLAQAQERAQRVRPGTSTAPLVELSVRELAAVLDVRPQTVNRWIRDGFSARSLVLWGPGAWRQDERGWRSLPVSELKVDALTKLQKERLNVAQLRKARAARVVDAA